MSKKPFRATQDFSTADGCQLPNPEAGRKFISSNTTKSSSPAYYNTVGQPGPDCVDHLLIGRSSKVYNNCSAEQKNIASSKSSFYRYASIIAFDKMLDHGFL